MQLAGALPPQVSWGDGLFMHLSSFTWEENVFVTSNYYLSFPIYCLMNLKVFSKMVFYLSDVAFQWRSTDVLMLLHTIHNACLLLFSVAETCFFSLAKEHAIQKFLLNFPCKLGAGP